jgi:hypothetical protein
MWQAKGMELALMIAWNFRRITRVPPADIAEKSTETNHSIATDTTDKQRVNVPSTKQS